MDSGPIYVGNLAGTTGRLLISFSGGGELGNSVYLNNLRFYRSNISVLISGDFNENGVVDAADYTVWRNGLGTRYTQADYEFWRANFGKSNGGNASLSATPEPTTFVCAIAIAMMFVLNRRMLQ
jgi:hypothetical protein